MPAEQAFQALRQAITNNPAVNVLLASEPDEDVVIQRLNLRDDLAAEFLAAARDSCSYRDGDFELRPYDPGYKPESREITYIELAGHAAIADQIRAFSQIQQAEIFSEDDEIVDYLRFYGIVISPSARRHAVFFRIYSPSKELTRRRGFAALFRGGQYDKLDTRIFLFDRQVDCFAWDGYLFIHNVTAFQRIFKYFEELRAKAGETVTAILAHIPISNADQFRTACTGQIQMVSKLAQIARKPYLNTVTMEDIKRTIAAFRLDVQIVVVDGQEQLLFEETPNKRWLILKLLDDAYLGSIMTNRLYEANSKSDI